METLELRKKEIKLHNAKINVIDVNYTDVERDTLYYLKELNFVNTKQYEILENKSTAYDLKCKQEALNKDIEFLNSNGFKVLSSEFVHEFTLKHNLEIDKAKRYILDIPLQNLKNINEKIDNFFKISNQLEDIIYKYRYNRGKKSKLEICNEYLYIIAPKEHFDKNIPLNDPDPIALFALSNGNNIHYLYLDAWDVEKTMFDNDTNNPELLN